MTQTLGQNSERAIEPGTSSGTARSAPKMPPVWQGRRRILLITLFILGVMQAVLALTMTFSVDQLLQSVPDAQDGAVLQDGAQWRRLLVLVGSVLGIGVARWLERIVAEDLGQDYVFEQRHRLVTSALGSTKEGRSLGVIVTRASNDLSAIRNWLALGIVPLITAVPLIFIVLGVLAFQNWPVALAVTIPMAGMLLTLPWMASVAHTRARTLRRYRGRLSARIADSVRAGESVQAAGALRRELKAVDRDSTKVVDAAVDRAAITGLIRAMTVTVASLSTVAVVVTATMGLVSTAGVASIMTLLGVLATPLGDLGKVVEYRQNYKAARRTLGPMLTEAEEIKKDEKSRERRFRKLPQEAENPAAGLEIHHLVVNGRVIPEVSAKPGERIHLVSEDPGQVRRAVHDLMAGRSSGPFDAELAAPEIEISGLDFVNAPGKVRRTLVGFASDQVPLERGSIRRLVSLRAPDASDAEIREVLEQVGLLAKVESREKGMGQTLKNGGAAWSPSDVMRLKLARALLHSPALLLLEGVDTALDADGLVLLNRIIAEYPGVVLCSSHRSDFFPGEFREWDLDGPSLLPEHFNRGWHSSGDAGEEDDD
ncbi:ABC transporter transmembrane domain-containing protein [Corynebacterium sp. A21]|uniref:ABC transporter transmembrane domain-containing protein n=1 Tax=Corynebacterium sp. A21 TaxID=3457318 RepID=UPI003FD3BFDD